MTEALVVAFINGWCVVELRTGKIITGPHESFEDACKSIQTVAWRISQGWPA